MEPERDIEATSPSSEEEHAAFCEEVRRIHRRYHIEVVERFGFCPWAEKARLDGRVRIEVVPSTTLEVAEVVEVVRRVEADDDTDVGMVVFPCVSVDRLPFARWVEEARVQCAEAGLIAFAFAAFHPVAEADLSSPGRAIPFLRRSPDPTIQLVGHAVLERARGSRSSVDRFIEPRMLSKAGQDLSPTHDQRVSDTNLKTLRRIGTHTVDRALVDISS